MSTGSDSEHDEEIRNPEIDMRIDDTGIANAATFSRLPSDRPTEHELAYFPELWENKPSTEIYLLIRNTTLATWQHNTWRECTASDVRSNLYPPFNTDLDLIQNIVHYLSRHGLINFGRYTRSTKINKFLVREKRSVIVIGAGAAGIAAATQLESFGFDVTIIEARNRIGGRAHNLVTKDGQIMETGADQLRGLHDSPLTILLHQVNMEQHPIIDNQFVFLDGKPVEPQRDKMIAGMYCSARGALNWMGHQQESHRGENGLYISRQQAYENVVSLVERGTLIKYYNHCKRLEEVARAREHYFNQLKKLKVTALMAERKLEELGPDEDPLMRRSLKRDISTAIFKFDEVCDALETADSHLQELQQNPCCKQYMHPTDFRSFNFLLGFEEYLFGAPLERVQFSCDANKIRCHGAVTRLTEGCAGLLTQVAERRKLKILLNHRVRDIDYSGEGQVKLKVLTEGGELIDMKAAIVVSTLPIGVLKKTIEEDERAPTFTPPLREKKVNAIRNLGSGLINKIILQFERSFWDTHRRYQFAAVSPTVQTRGSMLLWSAVPGSKVITTYLVGEAAEHNIPDSMIVQNAMDSLRKVFGHHCPKSPVNYHVTRWQDDEFAFGSGAYMSLRTEASDFDELLHPLMAADAKNRVYFAGEHTAANYTGTLQGAWMSGSRAAADIANDHIGVGWVDLGNQDGKENIPNGNDPIIEDRDGPMPEEEEAGPSSTSAPEGAAPLQN